MPRGRVVYFVLVLMLLSSLSALAQTPFQGWDDEHIEISFQGRGLETGKVLDVKISNKGDTRHLVQIPQFTVLEPADSRYSPVLLESYGGWEVEPGAYFTARLSGYSLEHQKDMPSNGARLTYTPSTGAKKYKPAQYALREGLKMEKRGKFRPLILSKEKHRLVVLQRAVWKAVGGKNPTGPEELYSDIARALKSKGKPMSEKATGALVASVWRDVEQIYKSLSSR